MKIPRVAYISPAKACEFYAYRMILSVGFKRFTWLGYYQFLGQI
jgi:hypothetical protein